MQRVCLRSDYKITTYININPWTVTLWRRRTIINWNGVAVEENAIRRGVSKTINEQKGFIRADECNKTTFTWMNFLLYTFILFQFTFFCMCGVHAPFLQHWVYTLRLRVLCSFPSGFFFIYLLCLIRLWNVMCCTFSSVMALENLLKPKV